MDQKQRRSLLGAEDAYRRPTSCVPRGGVLIGDQKTGHIEGVVLVASSLDGLTVLVDGAPARLAILTLDGKIIESAAVAKEAFAVSVNAYRDYLRGEGYLRTLSKPIPYPDESASVDDT